MIKIKLKKIILAMTASLFFTACGGNIFSILDDGSEEKESEFQKYIVTREVKLDELVGTWKVDEESKEKFLKAWEISNFFYESDEEKKCKKKLDEDYILINSDASAKFKISIEQEGKARSSNYVKEVFNHLNGHSEDVKEGAFLSISYRKESSWGSIKFDCLEIDGVLYLGKKYETGDIDAGDLKKYHLIFKKVK